MRTPPTLLQEYEAAQEACERFLADPSSISSRACGLCYNMLNEMRVTLCRPDDEETSEEFINSFKQMLRDWPDGTGDAQYPVPDPNDPDRAVDRADIMYVRSADIWNPADAYGMLRLRLTAYCAERFAALAGIYERLIRARSHERVRVFSHGGNMENVLATLREMLSHLVLPKLEWGGMTFAENLQEEACDYDCSEVAAVFGKMYRDAGFTLLGTGHFSAVFGHDSTPNLAYKVGFKQEDAYAAYVAYARQNPGPFIPKIIHAERVFQFQVTVLPKYETCYEYGKFDSMRYSDAFYEVERKIVEYFDGIASIDMHYGNIMQDPETGFPVITDPVSFTMQGDCYATREEPIGSSAEAFPAICAGQARGERSNADEGRQDVPPRGTMRVSLLERYLKAARELGVFEHKGERFVPIVLRDHNAIGCVGCAFYKPGECAVSAAPCRRILGGFERVQ